MVTRMIPFDVVREIHAEDDWLAVEVCGTAPGSDGLGEECWGVFEHERRLYRVKFVRGSPYWRSNVGPWENPFPQVAYDAEEIECTEVRAVQVVTMTYVVAEPEPVFDENEILGCVVEMVGGGDNFPPLYYGVLEGQASHTLTWARIFSDEEAAGVAVEEVRRATKDYYQMTIRLVTRGEVNRDRIADGRDPLGCRPSCPV